MITSTWRVVMGFVCLVLLLAGCTAPQKPSEKKAVAKEPSPPRTSAQKETAPPEPTKPKDIFSAFQTVALKIQSGDKVWVVSTEGKKPRDVRATHFAEEALRRIVTQRDKATLVESTTPALTALLELYLMKPLEEIPESDLVTAARTAGVTKILCFRARSVAPPEAVSPPFVTTTVTEEPMCVEARTIDVASGKVVAVAQVSTAPAPVAEPRAARAYPFRITDPQYRSRPDVPKPKEDANLLGRRFRAFTKFNDQLGPDLLYNNPDYDAWCRKNDQLGPFPFYSAEPTFMLITSTPPNARVFVNNQDKALTPCWLPLEEGDHVVIFKEGYIQEEFRVPAKRQAFHVDLRPR